jgi:putative endonuclease
LVSSPEQNRRSLGNRYEKQAENFLISEGYKILARNVQLGRQEIDLIALKDNTICFIEVKGGRSSRFGHPAERVTGRKRANLTLAAERYIVENNLDGFDYRFDLITILKGKLEHFPAAFESEKI